MLVLCANRKLSHMKEHKEGNHLSNSGTMFFLKREGEGMFKRHNYISRMLYNF